jgi:hypothetical protein
MNTVLLRFILHIEHLLLSQRGRTKRPGAGISEAALETLCGHLCIGASSEPQSSETADLVQSLFVLVQGCEQNKRNAVVVCPRLPEALIGLMSKGSVRAILNASSALGQVRNLLDDGMDREAFVCFPWVTQDAAVLDH